MEDFLAQSAMKFLDWVLLSEQRTIIDQRIKLSEEELERSKNAVTSSFIYSLQNLSVLTNQLNEYNTYLQEPNSFVFDLERMTSLGVEEVQANLKNYLSNNFVELQIVPKEVGNDG